MGAADETATFAVSLEDQISNAAERAAGSLERLKSQIDADKKALSGMQGAMRALKSASVPNVAAMAQLRDRIDAQKTSIASATAEYVKLGGTFKEVSKAADAVGGGFGKLLGASKKLPGPLGGMAAQLEDLGKLLSGGGLIAAGTLAVAAAMIALTAAVAVGVAALLRYGIASSDARRSEGLRIQSLGGTAAAALDAQRALDAVANSTAMPRAEVEGLAASLYRAGHRGAELEVRLRRLTIRKLGGAEVAARQMLSLDVQTRKLEESFAFLTSGLKIEGFLGALSEITQLLSANTASGRALKTIFEALFNPILGSLESAGPLAKRFFQGMVIAALELTIAVLKVGIWLKRAFGADILGGIDNTSAALNAGKLVVSMLAGALIVTAAAAGILAVALGLVVVAGLAIMAPFLLAGAAILWLGFKLVEAYQWAAGLDWSAIGQSLVDGLLGGIVRGSVRVIDAVRALALDAKSAMMTALGIASPSRVFASLGVQIPRGLAAGVEAGAPAAQRAVDGLVRVPSAAPAGGAAERSGEGARSVSIGELHVHTSATDSRGVAESLRDEVIRVFEDLAIEMGAPA